MSNVREPDLDAIRSSIERVGRLSDSVFRLGPLSVGLDGILSWIPGVGEVYSGAAAAFLLVQGARARVPAHLLLVCAGLMASRTAITAVPLLGPVASDLFLAHKWSARILARAIERRMTVSAAPDLGVVAV